MNKFAVAAIATIGGFIVGATLNQLGNQGIIEKLIVAADEEIEKTARKFHSKGWVEALDDESAVREAHAKFTTSKS